VLGDIYGKSGLVLLQNSMSVARLMFKAVYIGAGFYYLHPLQANGGSLMGLTKVSNRLNISRLSSVLK
jgi:hypothetical protein